MAEHTGVRWELQQPSMFDPDSKDTWDIFTPKDEHGSCEHIGVFMANSTKDGSPLANARLIAAAPELLAALDALADVSWTHLTGGYQNLIEDAQDAIRKAKGE